MKNFKYIILSIIFASTALANTEPLKESEDDLKAMFRQALAYYTNSDYKSAVLMFEAIEKQSQDLKPVADFYLGAIEAYNGNLENSYKYLDQAITSSKQDTAKEAFELALKLAYSNKDYDKILKLKELDKSQTSLTKWYYIDSLFKTGQKDEALDLLKEMIAQGIDDKNAIGVDLYIEALKDSEAIAKELKVDINGESRLAKFRQALSENKLLEDFKEDELSLYCLFSLGLEGNLKDVDILYKALLESTQAPYAWQASLLLADIAYKNKDYNLALRLANDAEFLAPPQTEITYNIYILRADSYRALADYDKAIDEYLKVAMNRKCVGEPACEALYKIGLCYYDKKEWKSAHGYFERVFLAYPKLEYWASRAYFYDAHALIQMGAKTDAWKTLKEYIRFAKDKSSPTFKKAQELLKALD